VVDELSDLQVSRVWYVVPSQPSAFLTHGQIPLRPVSWSVDAMAVRTSAAFVSLDQRPPQDLFDRGQVAHQFAPTFAQGRRGKTLDLHRTESHDSPNESETDSSVNPWIVGAPGSQPSR